MKKKSFRSGGKLIMQRGTMAVTILPNTNEDRKIPANSRHLGMPITDIVINGFFTVDKHWTVKYWNKAAEQLLKVNSEDIVGKNLWEKFADTLPVIFYSVYHRAFTNDIPFHFKEYWSEKGAWFDVITYFNNDILSVSFKSNSLPAHLLLPEHELKVLNDLYRFVTEVTNDCLWELDLVNNELFWIDGGHRRVFGYHIENALIPQSFWESRIHPEDRPRVTAKLKQTITETISNVWEDEYRFKKSDGEYLYVHDRGHIIFGKDNQPLRMIGATQDITAKKSAENKLVEERAGREKEIANAVLTAQEKERSDIGKELHDNLNQVLAVVKLYIQMAVMYDDKKDIHLQKSSALITDVIEEIRRISKNLVVPGTHIIGLFDNIRNLVKDLMMIDPIKIEFHTEGIQDEELDEKMQVNIFRIVQEQVNNILKHANATRAVIHLSKPGKKIILIISDNGQGCDMAIEKNGVGIINIKSRALLYNGSVDIISAPGKGYEIKISLSPDEH